jgi:hypothetical protein
MKAEEYRLTWSKGSRRARSHRARAKGLWALGRSRSPRPSNVRGTMERPWKQTRARRGVGGSALELGARWEGNRREARVSTGRGNAHRPGAQGACGNVAHGGTRHPPCVSKERGLETLRLQLCAPQFYPDLPWKAEGRHEADGRR